MPALNVRFVEEAKESVLERVTVLDPKFIVLTLLLLDCRALAVTLKFLVSKVPLVTVRTLVPMFNASASSIEPP